MVSIGRTGRATPFAVLEPVFVGGANVSLATLHNEDDVARKDVRPGDTVIVRRAGDVIPEVVGPVLAKRPKSTRRWKFPSKCPECGEPLVRLEGEANHHCVNVDCPMQRVQRIVHFAGRGAMDIEGLGEERVRQFVDAGLLTDAGDIYDADRRQARPARTHRRTQRAAPRGRDRRRRSSRPLWRLLVGLGINHVGPTAAQALARSSATSMRIADASEERLTAVDGIGPIDRAERAALLHDRPQPRPRRPPAGGRRRTSRAVDAAPAIVAEPTLAGHDVRAHRHARRQNARRSRRPRSKREAAR